MRILVSNDSILAGGLMRILVSNDSVWRVV